MSLIKDQHIYSQTIDKNNERFTKFCRRKKNDSKKIVGKYIIKGKLGQGSHGFVYKAINSETNQVFAVKILPRSQLNEDKVDEEINIHKSLKHESIVSLQEVIKTQNKIFIFLEYCENGDLFEFIKNKDNIDQETAARIFIKIYCALVYIHSKGVSHRDIKAENILLDSKMSPKLSDFGLAKVYNKNCQYLLTQCGSLNYTAPQIIMKNNYKPSLIDLWSLAVTLYLMLTKTQPFNTNNNKDITKLKIVSYQWPKHHCLSKQALQLFNSIFVPMKCRINLQQVRSSQFFIKYSRFYKYQENQVKEDQINIQKINNQNVVHSNPLQKTDEEIMKKQKQLEGGNYRQKRFYSKVYQNFLNDISEYKIRSEDIEKPKKEINNQIENSLDNYLVKEYHTIRLTSHGSRSIDPSNKFRVRKSLPKRVQNFQYS